MLKKRVYYDKAIKVEALSIVDQIADYIIDQHRDGTHNPESFSDILLFTAELLPYVEKKDRWIDLGYSLCGELKNNMECYGYHYRTAMLGGLGYQCFAVNEFCREANILRMFANSMNKLLFLVTENRLNQIKNHPTHDSNYDMVSGISGILYYLLDCTYDEKEKETIIKCIEYLLEFTEDTVYNDKHIIKFHILRPNQNSNFDQEDFKDGSINFGLAHGMLGPLVALAKAYAKGFVIDGLEQGIAKMYHLYETFQVPNEENVPCWPGIITVEEYWKGACRPDHLHTTSSWCYGKVGTLRALQKVTRYMNWKERENTHVEAMKRFLNQEINWYNLSSPSLCHGFSSIVAIQTCAYSVYNDPGLLTNLERNVKQIILGYRRSNTHEVSLIDIHERKVRIEGYLKDLSFLTGSTGVAATLLGLRGTMKTGKLLMID